MNIERGPRNPKRIIANLRRATLLSLITAVLGAVPNFVPQHIYGEGTGQVPDPTPTPDFDPSGDAFTVRSEEKFQEWYHGTVEINPYLSEEGVLYKSDRVDPVSGKVIGEHSWISVDLKNCENKFPICIWHATDDDFTDESRIIYPPYRKIVDLTPKK